MPDGLYDADILVWAETQADLLRRLAAGERVNESIDWPHVIEEVHDVGLSELRSGESLLLQGLLHLFKLHAWPASRSAEHWGDEADAFLNGARRRFTNAMRVKLDLADLYAEALRRTRKRSDDSGEPQSLPEVCPFMLTELFGADISALVSMLQTGGRPSETGP